jgi:hypothetical protein
MVRLDVRITGSDNRVLALPAVPDQPDALRAVFRRVEGMAAGDAAREIGQVRRVFDRRHRDLSVRLEEHYLAACLRMGTKAGHEEPYRSLLGAYFTLEYTLEAAALFNPSIVPHPDQRGAPQGGLRFVMSLRAVGEGHLSSTVFREGVIDAGGGVTLDDAPPCAVRALATPDQRYLKEFFRRKLGDLGTDLAEADRVLGRLGEWFTEDEMEDAIDAARLWPYPPSERILGALQALVSANYRLRLPSGSRIAELVMYPQSAYESRGIEDLRMVRFTVPAPTTGPTPPTTAGVYSPCWSKRTISGSWTSIPSTATARWARAWRSFPAASGAVTRCARA